MSIATIDDRKYGALLGKALPVVIRSEAEYRRVMKTAEALIERPEQDLAEEEGGLLELLSMLLEEYEDRVRPLPKIDPGRMLAYLLKERGMRPADLAAVLPKSRVSEIVAGNRTSARTKRNAWPSSSVYRWNCSCNLRHPPRTLDGRRSGRRLNIPRSSPGPGSVGDDTDSCRRWRRCAALDGCWTAAIRQ